MVIKNKMTANDWLLKVQLRHTVTREKILNVLLQSSYALSESEILAQLDIDCDRTTIYRTLNTLKNESLIHRVIVDNNNKYMFCAPKEKPETIHKTHAHFKCNDCGQVCCMENILVKEVSLPKGFIGQEKNLLIMGICSSCNTAR